MKAAILALVMAFVATPGHAAAPPRTPVQTITYETGPCFGACPVYRVSISSDGVASFEGIRFTAVIGPRSSRAPPAQYRAFAAQLEPVRPARGSIRYEGRACRGV